jgi:hypothetical protein
VSEDAWLETRHVMGASSGVPSHDAVHASSYRARELWFRVCRERS